MPSTEPDLTVLRQRLSAIDASSLADAGKGVVRVLPAALRPVRPGLRMLGRAVTVDAREDLMPVLAGLARGRPGRRAGRRGATTSTRWPASCSRREALRRGLAGIVIDGLCRDSRTLAEMDLPVYARGVGAQRVPGAGRPGHPGADQRSATVEVRPGDMVLGDDDGVGRRSRRRGRRRRSRRPRRSSAARRRCARRSWRGVAVRPPQLRRAPRRALQTGGTGTLTFS